MMSRTKRKSTRHAKKGDESKDSFMTLCEKIDVAKLRYVMRHYTDYTDVLNLRPERHDKLSSTSPHVLNSRYLARCNKSGVLRVQYKQRDSKGRFTAKQSVSLQCMQRQIRHTVAGEFYDDIDIVNCHPVILLHMLEEEGMDCKELAAYVDSPEACRVPLMKKGGLSRDQAKRVYLSLVNGGCAAHREAIATIRSNGGAEVTALTDHLAAFKDEMCAAHVHFAKRDAEAFAAHCERKRARGCDHNLAASYMNTPLCDFEKEMLQAMYHALGRPMDCVLCFDGIMVPKQMKVGQRVKELELAIRRATHINAKLKIKPMEEGLVLP